MSKNFYVEAPPGYYYHPCCGELFGDLVVGLYALTHCNVNHQIIVESFEVEEENDLYYLGTPNTEVYCPACGKKAVSQKSGTFVAKNSQLNYRHDCGNMLVIVMGKARKNATVR